MPREELLGLLNTMTPIDEQRITAEIHAATPSDLVIRFKQHVPVLRTRRILVIGASFTASFVVGLVAAALL